MNNSKDFHLGDILTLTTGETVEKALMMAEGGIVAVRNLIAYITGEEGLTDTAVIILAPKCRQALLRQHVELSNVVGPPQGMSIEAWENELIERFGNCLPVKPL